MELITNKAQIYDDLFNNCISNKYCAELYHQNKVLNQTTFNYLIKPLITGLTSYESFLLDNICNQTENNALKYLWILNLINHRLEYNFCDFNHELVLNNDGSTYTCVCKPDRQCNDSNTDYRFLTGCAIFIMVLLVVLIILMVIRIFIDRNEFTRTKKGSFFNAYIRFM